jgi:acetylornithine deacetylase/succinyl-diaminopimelate desuccinylase-like protein
MFGVTFTPTRIRASEKINVIPSSAELRVDCRVPPGLGEAEVLAAIEEVLGAGHGDTGDSIQGDSLGGVGGRVSFTERVVGNRSPIDSPLMQCISDWIAEHDAGAETVPVILPGFTDSRHFRAAFPECVAYGFFPHRHQSLFETMPLMHGADERIDVRDLAFAAEFFRDTALRILS